MNVHNFFFVEKLEKFSDPIKSIENPIKFKIECILHLLLDAYSIYLLPAPPLRKLTLRIFQQCRRIVFQLICRFIRLIFYQRKSIYKNISSHGLPQKSRLLSITCLYSAAKIIQSKKKYNEQKFVKKCRTWGSSLPFSSWLGHYSPKATPRLSNQQLSNNFKPEPNINIDANIQDDLLTVPPNKWVVLKT